MIFAGEVSGELGEGKDGGVDLPSDCLLDCSQPGSDVHRAHTAKEHEIDVAARTFFSTSQRPVDEGNFETFRAGDRLAKHGYDTAGLLHQSEKFREDGGGLIGFDIASATVNALFQDAHADKRIDLPLQRRRASSKRGCQFAQIPGFVRPQKERCQDGLAGWTDQGRERGVVTHIAFIITQIAL